jgi:hypothetical protein
MNMEAQINHTEIKAYCQDVAKKMITEKLSGKDFLSGKELLGFSGIEQTDRFIIRAVFKAWNNQLEKAKSQYFDNENSEVLELLKTYGNKLSFHIKIAKKDLFSLLEEALEKTLIFFFIPDSFLLNEYSQAPIPMDAFVDDLAYLRFYQEECKSLKTKLEKGEEFKNALSKQEFGDEDQQNIISLERFKEFEPENIFRVTVEDEEKSMSKQGKVFENFEKEPSIHEKFETKNGKEEEYEESEFEKLDLKNLGLNEKIYFSKQFFGGNKIEFEEFVGGLLDSDSFHQAREKFNTYSKLKLSGKEGMEARNRFLTALEDNF